MAKIAAADLHGVADHVSGSFRAFGTFGHGLLPTVGQKRLKVGNPRFVPVD
jgi:hypothetical protein